MKSLITVFSIVLLGACQQTKDFSPDDCFGKEVQQRLLREMVRYSSKLAPEATHETKFDPQFNWYYDKAVAEASIMFCKLNEPDSSYQLLVAREARSITPMKEGIAVKVKFDKNDRLEVYEEIFRMWKMPEDSLRKRGEFLFQAMIKGNDLTLYYSKFQRDRFIEFPDDRFTFDIMTRRWKDKELDSLNLE